MFIIIILPLGLKFSASLQYWSNCCWDKPEFSPEKYGGNPKLWWIIGGWGSKEIICGFGGGGGGYEGIEEGFKLKLELDLYCCNDSIVCRLFPSNAKGKNLEEDEDDDEED